MVGTSTVLFRCGSYPRHSVYLGCGYLSAQSKCVLRSLSLLPVKFHSFLLSSSLVSPSLLCPPLSHRSVRLTINLHCTISPVARSSPGPLARLGLGDAALVSIRKKSTTVLESIRVVSDWAREGGEAVHAAGWWGGESLLSTCERPFTLVPTCTFAASDAPQKSRRIPLLALPS